MVAYKLFTRRKDGTLGPLFINRRQRVPIGRWVEAEPHRTRGFAFRPGWHACVRPFAPHLSKRGRVWCKVTLSGVQQYSRPAAQGGTWYTAQFLKVERILP